MAMMGAAGDSASSPVPLIPGTRGVRGEWPLPRQQADWAPLPWRAVDFHLELSLDGHDGCCCCFR